VDLERAESRRALGEWLSSLTRLDYPTQEEVLAIKRFATLAAALLALALVTPASASSNVGFNVGIWMPGASIQFRTEGPPPPPVYYAGPYVIAGIGVPLYYYAGTF